ncbi:MAG: hypothetical protein ACRYFZ_09445 [Janthinobacterium lividum]
MLYPNAHALEAAPISERIDLFRCASIKAMQQGVSLMDMLEAKADALLHERYEMVRGIELAIDEFGDNPQLVLI